MFSSWLTPRALPLSSHSRRRGLRSAGRWSCPALPSGGCFCSCRVKGALRPCFRSPDRWNVIRRAGSAALDLFGFGDDRINGHTIQLGSGAVLADPHPQPGEAEQHHREQRYGQTNAPEEIGLFCWINHGSPHQLERFVNRDVGRGPASVEHNAPVLRGPGVRLVFHAE